MYATHVLRITRGCEAMVYFRSIVVMSFIKKNHVIFCKECLQIEKSFVYLYREIKTSKVMKTNNNCYDWRNEVCAIRSRLESIKVRSCWERGVKSFALDLLDKYDECCAYADANGSPVPELTETTLLNGSSDWYAYCYVGMALIYDGDIARTLCTPSELARTSFGDKAPNPRETWMDVQARAYRQAFNLLMSKK